MRPKSLVHRNYRLTVAINAALVSQGFSQSLAECNGDVFNRMMIVDLQITFAVDVEVKQSMFGKEPSM